MAKDRVIEITGYIEKYAFSMGYIKYLMKELGEGPITVKVTSYGGDVNHALKIKDLFASHGDVTVEYVGLNASAATLIGHGAKKTIIHEDSLYLIHKPMVWVDTWGSMNEDELTQAITDLQAQKKDAETFTLVLAQDYVNSRGMDIKTVMSLMKESRWLSAEEAVKLGLVDEIIPSINKKPVISNQAIAIMNANGLPIPEFNGKPKNDLLTKISNGVDRIIDNFLPKNKSEMNKTFLCINKILNVEGIESTDGKFSLSLEQITVINAKLTEMETAVTNADTARQTAEIAQVAAENSLNELAAAIDAINPTVKAAQKASDKAAAINAILASRPGVKAEAPQGESGKSGELKNEADFNIIDNLPHNREADTFIV
ncbi:ATP-dependent Clp protease protease subunit [Dysgonomonas sp. PH5-45]|uniref:Clp protease ClpP n=1 Tax=unclassified Dysgonomonas TaxID=2630389 RepID=UPI002476CD0E|nr:MULTISPECIES: Clp protease ClpP [unclassified Dysgonomonas]MDH6355458.1 ATP-dependent Clp protease protease subunit [Dysgonomonas sp. PH5-45]MDH6388354.1 ATP-dependent Clp protease protease subunit [Dysgonomonas sp. PH5-37]